MGGKGVEEVNRNYTMLQGISPLISPELLCALCKMGHGDEIVFADVHFPAYSVNTTVFRADGLSVPQMLEAVLPLFPLDHAVQTPINMMKVQDWDTIDETVEPSIRAVVDKFAPKTPPIQRLERSAFYERTQKAFCVVMTGETRTYGNVILAKGVVRE